MASGTEKRARTVSLTIRLTVEERSAIDEAALRAGLTAGSHARNILLGIKAPRQVRRPPVERVELARLLGQLGKIGSNLNQLAREANQGHDTIPTDIRAALAELKVARDAILTALGRVP